MKVTQPPQLYISPLLQSLLSRLYLSPIVQLGCRLYISESFCLFYKVFYNTSEVDMYASMNHYYHIIKPFTSHTHSQREAAKNKRSSSFNGRAINTYPPSPLQLNGRWNVGTLEKQVPKKVIFSVRFYETCCMCDP